MLRSCLLTTFVGTAASLVATTSGLLLGSFHSHQTASPSRRTNTIMRAKSNSNNGKDKAVIDLQLHTIRQSPAETLASLSEACNTLGVESFDVYGDYQSNPQQSYLRQFESEVARCFGKDDAVFCLSGGVAQSIALMIHANSHSTAINDSSDVRAFACHPTSHLLLHEDDAYSELLGMEALITGSTMDFDIDNFKQNGCYGMAPMMLSDVKDILSSDNNDTLTTYPNQKSITCNDISALMLELPHREIGGKLTPWDEVQSMSALCKEKGVKLHCDGARIFEASAGYGHEALAQTAEPFDSVYISFYKGVGAVSGAMLLGDSEFIAEARIWLRRFGGNLYSVLPYAVSSWDGFRKNCRDDVFVERRRKLARVIDVLNADSHVQSIVQFDPAVPQTSMIHGYLKASLDDCKRALLTVEQSTGIRVLMRLNKVNDDESSFGCRFEWSVGTSNVLIDDGHFIKGWQEFSRVLDGIVSG
uniref:Aromatic amino acid beta-eliminating lyase/threonine aldolase domain-containing protein n=1 Tax=Skeletonema marinoi TaxID=267567 RepID=A0A7S2MBC8_9STRA|mmetsp:Transcript_7448/g.12480  ORF Transcript_7448/g.12480 Transcript_7448/m.12480 type:complete len:474 (+) Transcript_7448:86-1507(+)